MTEVATAPVESGPVALFEDLSQPASTENALTTTNSSTELTTSTDGTIQRVRKTKIIKRKRRPARPQQDPALFKNEPPPQTGTIFNVW